MTIEDAMPPLAIINCDILTPTRRIPQGLVLIDGGVIRAVGRSQEVSVPADVHLIDARGGWITPGLIDLARFGQGGPAPESVGVTSFAQVVTLRSEDDLRVLVQAAENLSPSPFVARPLGLHVILGADAPMWDDLWAAADAAIALVSLSPTQPGASMLLRQLLAARVPCLFDWQDVAQPPADPLVHDLLACGLAAIVAPPSPIPGLLAPHWVAAPAQVPSLLPLLGWEGLLLAGNRDRPLQGGDLYALSKEMQVDLAAVLAAASLHPARFLRLAQGLLAAGAPADLLCWTRFGEPAWTMVGGQVR